MTIEQLAEQATDSEGFSHDGEVVVLINDEATPVSGAWWDTETNQLVLSVARPNVAQP